MNKRSLLIAALAPAALLGGCGGTPNRGLESVHQPVVARTDYVFDVNTAGNGLAPGEGRRLAGWMDSLRLGYGDRVAIDEPGRDSYGLRNDVQAVLSQYGLLLSTDTPITGAPVAPGTARVVVSRLKASVPGCPDFSREGQNPEFESNTSSNHGCATNANLASMIANPGDLVRGQPGAGVSDTLTTAKAINAFRGAAPSGGGGTQVKSDGAGGK